MYFEQAPHKTNLLPPRPMLEVVALWFITKHFGDNNVVVPMPFEKRLKLSRRRMGRRVIKTNLKSSPRKLSNPRNSGEKKVSY